MCPQQDLAPKLLDCCLQGLYRVLNLIICLRSLYVPGAGGGSLLSFLLFLPAPQGWARQEGGFWKETFLGAVSWQSQKAFVWCEGERHSCWWQMDRPGGGGGWAGIEKDGGPRRRCLRPHPSLLGCWEWQLRAFPLISASLVTNLDLWSVSGLLQASVGDVCTPVLAPLTWLHSSEV